MLRNELCSSARPSDFEEAAGALKEVVTCLETIWPFPSRDLAAAYMALGDMLKRSDNAIMGRTDPSLVIQAQEAYDKALNMLNILYGPSHPESLAAASAKEASRGRGIFGISKLL